jgi:hypothetical protein
MSKEDYAKIIGKSIFFAGLQSAFGSVLMSSTFSVVNFSKDQQTLQGAADALKHYMFVAIVWTVATMLVMYGKYSYMGVLAGFLANALIVGWIYGLYVHAFNTACKKYGLRYPRIF